MTYLLAVLGVFLWLCDGQDNSKDQLLIWACVSLVWPVLVIGKIYQNRHEIAALVSRLLDFEAILMDIEPEPQEITWTTLEERDLGI
jgi:hypothetical protein